MKNEKEPILKRVVTAAVGAWTEVGRAFLGTCGGQDEEQKPLLSQQPTPLDKGEAVTSRSR